jgi:hypothetical protein
MTIVKVFQYSADGGRNEEVKILSGLIEENFPEFRQQGSSGLTEP